jgi:hypothetical protein
LLHGFRTKNPWGGGEAGMFVHDPKHDILVTPTADVPARRSTTPDETTPTAAVPRTLNEGLSMFCTRLRSGLGRGHLPDRQGLEDGRSRWKLKLEECGMRTLLMT